MIPSWLFEAMEQQSEVGRRGPTACTRRFFPREVRGLARLAPQRVHEDADTDPPAVRTYSTFPLAIQL